MTRISISHLSKTYHNRDNSNKLALDNVNLEFSSCGLVIILGSSGCGKTTLLNILAKRDKDYDGKIEGLLPSDMIDQDFKLFESLSVLDNLLLVSKDKVKIEHYLKDFELFDQKDKKVKKLSNGQKRRLQVIRSFLNMRDLLLCDEPTAALDNEMATLVMDKLKYYGKDHLVIIVTHDIALAEKYADRLIGIEDGKIIEDKTLHSTQHITKHRSIIRHGVTDHLRFAFKYLKSRPLAYGLTIVFVTVIMFLTYITYSLFMTVQRESNEKIAFREHTNLIVSEPYKERQPVDGSDRFILYDYYTKDQITSLINYCDEIVAVQMYTDSDLYWPMNQSSGSSDGASFRGIGEDEYQLLLDEYFENMEDSFFSSDLYIVVGDETMTIEVADPPYTLPGLMNDDAAEANISSIKNNSFEFYDIVSDYDFPIAYGKMPSGDDEVLISYNAAEYLQEFYSAQDISGLIGRELTFGIVTENTRSAPFDEQIPNISKVRIAGITTISFDDERALFFDNGLMNNVFYDSVIKDKDSYRSDYVKIFINPKTDVDKTLNEINKVITHKYSRFIEYNLSYRSEGVTYDSASTLLIYLLILDIIFYLGYLVSKIADLKRNRKESDILRNYNYNSLFIATIKSLFLMFISAVIFVVSIYFLMPIIDGLAQTFNYAAFMSFDVLGIAFVISAMTLLIVITNGAVKS